MADYQQNFLSSIAGGLNIGQQVRGIQDRNQLNKLASQSYGASTPEQQQGLLTSMAVIDPAAAQGQQKQFQNDEDRRNKTLANMANLLVNSPEQARASVYAQMVPTLAKFGLSELPQQYDAQTAPIINKTAQAIYQAYSGTAGATPTDVRSFQMMTAGLSPDDRERARRVSLGLDGRASSSGFSQVKVTGADGRERVGVLNGRTGQIDLPDGTSFNPQNGAITPTQGAPQPMPQGGAQQAVTADAALANQMIAAGIPESQVDAFLASRASQASGESRSWGADAPASSPVANNPSAFVGRTPEEQAAATEAAKLNVQQQFLPQELAVRTQAALNQEAGKAGISQQADRTVQQVTRTRDADKTLALLDEAVAILPNATGGYLGAATDRALGAFNQSTPGAQATAKLRTIAGQLTSSMPRMEGPQSDRDVQMYKEMAGDLANDALPVATRLAAAQQIRALNEKYASRPSAPAQVRSAADYNALPSGTIYIDPNGQQRRKP